MSAPVDFPGETARQARRRSELARACDGAVAVEFAIVPLSLILLLLGICEFGWFLWSQSTLQQAVEATARYCSINPSCDVQTTGASYLLSLNVTPTFTLTTPSCGTQVSASFTFTTILGGYVPDLTVSSQSCYPSTP